MTEECEHDFHYTIGIDVADLRIAAKMCKKCNKVVKLGVIGIDDIESGWHKWYAEQVYLFILT
jgi:hypothetical protein